MKRSAVLIVGLSVLVPYARGDLIDRIHKDGEITALEHTADGTQVSGRASEALASDLATYAV